MIEVKRTEIHLNASALTDTEKNVIKQFIPILADLALALHDNEALYHVDGDVTKQELTSLLEILDRYVKGFDITIDDINDWG